MLKFLALGVAAITCASTLAAVARDRGGCRGSELSCEELRYYCGMGSQTPFSVREFCGRGRGGYGRDGRNDDWGRRRGLSLDELRYYCSLGEQTPISARDDCVRAGLW